MKEKHVDIFTATLLIILPTIATLAAIKYLDIYYPIKITQQSTSGEFVITGEGQVDVTSDTAYLDIGITVLNEPTAESARNKVNEVNNRIVDAAAQNGIPKEDIKTSNYNVSPREQFTPEGRLSTGQTTYYGNANLTIKTPDIAKAQNLTQVFSEAGATNVNVRFGIDDPNKYREEARNKAIANAREQAEKLSKELGIKIGRITNAVEGGTSAPLAMYDKALSMEGRGGDGSSPVFEPGTQTITTTMTLYFEKK